MFQQPQIPDTFLSCGGRKSCHSWGGFTVKTQTHVAPCHGCSNQVRHSLSNCLTERPYHQWLPGLFSQRKNVSYHKMVPFVLRKNSPKSGFLSDFKKIVFKKNWKWRSLGKHHLVRDIHLKASCHLSNSPRLSPQSHLEEGWDCLAVTSELQKTSWISGAYGDRSPAHPTLLGEPPGFQKVNSSSVESGGYRG